MVSMLANQIASSLSSIRYTAIRYTAMASNNILITTGDNPQNSLMTIL